MTKASTTRLPAALVAGLLVLGGAWAAGAEEVKESQPLLGTILDVMVDSPDLATGQDRIRRAMEVARQLEAELDAASPESALSRLNARAGLGPMPVPIDLYRLLALSELMTRSTGGAFDVTIGPLLELRHASDAEFDEALSLVGADKISLAAPGQAALVDAGMSVDFSAIVRGYILERMAYVLRGQGVTRALLQFDDRVALAIGPPEGEEPFRVWVGRGKTMTGSVALRDRAMATARARPRGDQDSRPPIVDPRSGRFVESDRQATAVARDAAIADAWSTALVVDPDGALGLLEEPRDVEALVFDEHGEHSSPRFEEFAGWLEARGNVAPREAGPRAALPERRD